MEIPSSAAGVLKELKVKVGDTVNIGDLIADARRRGQLAGRPPHRRPLPAAARGAAAPRRRPRHAAPHRRPGRRHRAAAPRRARPDGAPNGSLPHASPSVRKFARELGVPLDEVKGSGPKGRITQEDIQGFTKRRDERRGDHQGRSGQGAGRASAVVATAPGWACCPGRRSTSPSSARSSARTCRASRRSAAPTCTATG